MINPQYMLSQINAAPVAFMEFTRVYSKNKNKVFCFHEGEMDDKYYSLRIEADLRNFSVYYKFCQGKDNVKTIQSIIKKNADYKETRAIYLVDSDFDNSLNIPSIYETPCYSIENFYVGEDTLRKIIERELYIFEDDENYNIILSKFRELQEEFHEKTIELNSWIYYQRIKEKELAENRKLHLDTLKQTDLYKITLNGIEKKYDLEFLKSKFPNAYTISQNELDAIREDLNDKNACLFFRGKFEFYFMCSFLELIITEYNNCKKGRTTIFIKHEDMKTVSLNVSSKSEKLLSPLSVYASTPPCLDIYIKRMKLNFKEVS